MDIHSYIYMSEVTEFAQSCPTVCSPMDCSQTSLSITGTKNQIRVWKIGKSRRAFLAEETALAKA